MKKRIEHIVAVAVVFVFEMGISTGVAAVAGCMIIPFVQRQRGYEAVGGEWLLLMAIAILAYSVIHYYIFAIAEKIAKKGGKQDGKRIKSRSRRVAGVRNPRMAVGGCQNKSRRKTRKNYSA